MNSSSQHVRNFYITFLLAGIYIAIIIWSTTDMMLLKETPVNLPLLNAELPITGFYRFAPYFYLLVHFNLLLQLSLLSDKLHAYNAALSKLADNEARKYYDIRLFPFAFSHTLSGAQHSWILKFLLTAMVWITMIWLPLCLLIGLQVGFLAYHSEQVLALQRWAIAADLFILALFWPIIRSPDGKWTTWVLRATGSSTRLTRIIKWIFLTVGAWKQGEVQQLIQCLNPKDSGLPQVEGKLILITMILVIGFSCGIAVLPNSDKEDEPDFFLTEYLFGRTDQTGGRAKNSIFHRNLRLREKLLIANELKPEDVALLKDNGNEVPEAVLKKVVGLDLKGRDLRYADFSKALMPKVDFGKINRIATKLGYADFARAKLFHARIDEAQLQGAKLKYAQLQGANLGGAQLQGANLDDARLQGANLDCARRQGANLVCAQLQGASLDHAFLQGANLNGAQLQGTSLDEAFLQGANLNGAQLQGASLSRARLKGASLNSAHLQAVNFDQADLTLSKMINSKFGKISEQYIEQLLEDLRGVIVNPKMLKSIKDRLSEAMQRPVTLDAARGLNIWIENPDEIVLKAVEKSKGDLVLAKSRSKYQNDLVEFLIEQSCQDKWVASGIIRYRIRFMPLKSSFVQCLLSLKDKKTKPGLAVCPGSSGINNKDIESFKHMASITQDDNNIQATFKCEGIVLDDKGSK